MPAKFVLNRLLSVNDYKENNRRKGWEVDMAMRTIKAHVKLLKEAEILGVGAGVEHTIFRLSNLVKRVFATDLYVGNPTWDTAPMEMLIDPAKFAHEEEFDRQRIVVQHMDGRDLRYPDDTFDGIFSSGSIEHFGTWEDVEKAAREIGRVLKPGGVASISTEFRLSGEGDGWPGILLFTPERIQQHIIGPSGLELIDEPNWDKGADQDTLDTVWSLDTIVLKNEWPDIEGVLSSAHGYSFTSVHLALKKPAK